MLGFSWLLGKKLKFLHLSGCPRRRTWRWAALDVTDLLCGWAVPDVTDLLCGWAVPDVTDLLCGWWKPRGSEFVSGFIFCS